MSKRKEQEIEDNDLVSYLEEKLGHLKPYWSQITLGICVAILALLGCVFLWQQSAAAEAATWQSLNIARGNYERSGDNTSLKDFADQNPDNVAGLWGLLYSADAEIRSGLSQLGTDRTEGFKKIEKARDFYKKVVDSSVTKTPMLKRRSVFGLAYAYESNGEFEEAAKLYTSLVDAGKSNPFYGEALRGKTRVENSAMKDFFKKFKEFVPVTEEEAPGESLPERPNISFEGDAEQPNSGGGDFGEGGDDNNAAAPTETPETSDDSPETGETEANGGEPEAPVEESGEGQGESAPATEETTESGDDEN